MDIAKYIGLYLLKNNFCYIHGLGNLELKKKPASYDGQALQAPAFEVTLSPTGSIDDGLANFIATNEQISIAKAANSLREFSTNSRTKLHEGEEVIIPSIGKFVEHNGRVGFITDPHLQYTPPAIPTIKSAPHIIEERRQQAAPVHKTETKAPVARPRVNWGPIILVGVAIVVIAAIAFFGIQYISNRNSQMAEEAVVETPVDTPQQQAVITVDTAALDTTTAPASNMQLQNGMLSFKVVLNTYKDSTSANKRAKKLTSYGNAVEVAMQDSAWHVVMPMTAAPADTTRVLDSLRRNFNPKGVSILP
jgi:nucleoid DNA-binding protein